MTTWFLKRFLDYHELYFWDLFHFMNLWFSRQNGMWWESWIWTSSDINSPNGGVPVWPRPYYAQGTFFLDFQIPCVFHGKFHPSVSDSFTIKGSEHWFRKSRLMFQILLGCYFFFLLRVHRSLINVVQTFACLIVEVIRNRGKRLLEW